MNSPTAEQVAAARKNVGQTQEQAIAMVRGNTAQSWRNWEKGKQQMPLGLWELYLIKTGQVDQFKETLND